MSPASPARPPFIALIVLTWNGRALTLDCLASLEAVRTPGLRVYLVDNASSDGTTRAVRERYPGVMLLENPSNLGYAAGNNAGIRRALDDGADLILLLNNDTLVDPAFVDELARPLVDDPSIGVTGPKTYFASPQDMIWFAGGIVSPWKGTARHIGIRETDRGQHDTPRDIDYASGCALMTRRDVLDRVGMLDPAYHAYFEDTDFCTRVRRAGWRIRYVPAARVWHRVSASTGGQLSRRKITRKLKSARRYFARYARPWHWTTIPLFFALDVIRIGLLVASGRIRGSRSDVPHSSS